MILRLINEKKNTPVEVHVNMTFSRWKLKINSPLVYLYLIEDFIKNEEPKTYKEFLQKS